VPRIMVEWKNLLGVQFEILLPGITDEEEA
jgi:hypothetical protein